MSRKKKDRSVVPGFILQMFIGAFLGGFCGFYGAKTGFHMMGGEKSILGMLLGVLLVALEIWLSLYLQTIIHEGGHLVCGLLNGYGFVSFRVGSRILIKSQDKLRVKKYSLMGTAGQCLLSPPKWEEDRFPYVFYNIGGCLFNLIFSAVFIILHFLLKENTYVSGAFLVAGIIGFYLAVMNGIPLRIGGIENDAFNIRAMKRSLQARRSFWIIMEANAQNARGIRAKDMPSEWFEMPSDESLDNSLTASVAVLACNRAMDEKELEKAWEMGNHLLKVERGMSQVHRYMGTLDMLFCALILDKEPGKFIKEYESKKFAKILKSLSAFPSVLRACYAYELLYKRDISAAEKKKAQFEALAKTYPYECEIESERELMSIAEEKAKQETSAGCDL